MSKGTTIVVNYAGVGELLRSMEMEACVLEIAQQVQARCGDGYDTDTYQAGTRVIASCFTATEEAVKDNLENNTLLHAIGG